MEEGVERTRALRVLLAEDNAVNQKLVVRLLEKQGHTVEVASNGREAVLAATGETRFDVILMDVQMPEMDGYRATRLIRAAHERRGIRVPILALTAHAMDSDRERSIEAGMDDHVNKPVHLQELLMKLEQHTAQLPLGELR